MDPTVCLILILLLSLLGGTAGGVMWIALLRYTRAGQGQACCAQCGTTTRGLEQLQCPHCQSDLREVGILPPARPLGPRTQAVLSMLLTLLLVVPLAALFWLVLGLF